MEITTRERMRKELIKRMKETFGPSVQVPLDLVDFICELLGDERDKTECYFSCCAELEKFCKEVGHEVQRNFMVTGGPRYVEVIPGTQNDKT